MIELGLRVGTLQGAPAAIVTADAAGLARMTPYWAMNGRRAAGQDECVMGRRLAQTLGASVGAIVEVRFVGVAENVLADEPTGNLDEENEARVLDVFRSLHREGKTVVVVTHDPEIGYAGERIVALAHGKLVKYSRNTHDAQLVAAREVSDLGHRRATPAGA